MHKKRFTTLYINQTSHDFDFKLLRFHKTPDSKSWPSTQNGIGDVIGNDSLTMKQNCNKKGESLYQTLLYIAVIQVDLNIERKNKRDAYKNAVINLIFIIFFLINAG